MPLIKWVADPVWTSCPDPKTQGQGLSSGTAFGLLWSYKFRELPSHVLGPLGPLLQNID